jgi:hypothetical protein
VKIKRIRPPSWARKPRQDYEGIPPEGVACLQSGREELLAAVHAEVSSYLSDPQLVFGGSEDFPSRRRLTGDYYIGDESYCVDPDTAGYRISVMARCLANPLSPQSAPDDYLGLEVWLAADAGCRTFTTFRNTDSSVI